MARERLQDNAGRTIGYIVDESRGQRIEDPCGRTLGHYDEDYDKTLDNTGHTIGTGNQLTRFL